MDAEHLLEALLEQPEGVASRLLARLDVTAGSLLEALRAELDRRPSVSGPGVEPGKIYLAARLQQVLYRAEDEAKRLKDDYVSIEHLLLAVLAEGKDAPSGRLLHELGVDRNRFLAALTAVRGSQRVTSATPPTAAEREP